MRNAANEWQGGNELLAPKVLLLFWGVLKLRTYHDHLRARI
jgi:hypothetical protein